MKEKKQIVKYGWIDIGQRLLTEEKWNNWIQSDYFTRYMSSWLKNSGKYNRLIVYHQNNCPEICSSSADE